MAREIKTKFAKALKIEGILEVAKLKGVFVVPLNGGNKIRVYYNGKNPAGLLSARVMAKVHSKLADKSFTKPFGVNITSICSLYLLNLLITLS